MSWSAVLLAGLVSVSSELAVTLLNSVSPAAPGAVSYWKRTYSVLVWPLATTPAWLAAKPAPGMTQSRVSGAPTVGLAPAVTLHAPTTNGPPVVSDAPT